MMRFTDDPGWNGVAWAIVALVLLGLCWLQYEYDVSVAAEGARRAIEETKR